MNFTNRIWEKMSSLIMPETSEDKDKGAGFIEYAAVILLVGAVAAVVINSNIGDVIVQGITSAISEALNPSSDPGVAPAPAPTDGP